MCPGAALLAPADVGATVYAKVRAHNAAGWSSWVTTNAVGRVWDGTPQVPGPETEETGGGAAPR